MSWVKSSIVFRLIEGLVQLIVDLKFLQVSFVLLLVYRTGQQV